MLLQADMVDPLVRVCGAYQDDGELVKTPNGNCESDEITMMNVDERVKKLQVTAIYVKKENKIDIHSNSTKIGRMI